MQGSKRARSFKRAFSINQPPQNHSNISLQDYRQNCIFCFQNIATSSNHAVSQNRPTIEIPSNGEVNILSPNILNTNGIQFGDMSRTELELFAQMKMIEANSYKYHFKEMEKQCNVLTTALNEMKKLENKCNVLQSSLDEMKCLYARTDKKHGELKRQCNRFILDLQRAIFDDGIAPTTYNIAAMDTGSLPLPPPISVNKNHVEKTSNNLTKNNNINKRRRMVRASNFLRQKIELILPRDMLKPGKILRLTAMYSYKNIDTNKKRSVGHSSLQTAVPTSSNTMKTSAVPYTSTDPKPSNVTKGKPSDEPNAETATASVSKVVALSKTKTTTIEILNKHSSANPKSANSSNIKPITAPDSKTDPVTQPLRKSSTPSTRVRTSHRSESSSASNPMANALRKSSTPSTRVHTSHRSESPSTSISDVSSVKSTATSSKLSTRHDIH